MPCTSHETNRMLMKESKGLFSFAFDSAHVNLALHINIKTISKITLNECFKIRKSGKILLLTDFQTRLFSFTKDIRSSHKKKNSRDRN